MAAPTLHGGARRGLAPLHDVLARAARATWLLVLLVLTFLGGCEPAARTARQPAAPEPPAAAAQIARRLPAETGWLVLIPSVSALVRQWLPDEGSKLRRRLGLESLRWLEEDLLSSAARARVGLDPDGMAGAAAVGAGGRTTVIFAAVADRAAFLREAMRRWRLLEGDPSAEVVGDDALLVSSDPSGPALLVWPELAMLVVDDGDERPSALARELVVLEEGDSLGATAPFTALARELPAGDLWGFVQLGQLGRAALGLEPELAGRTAADAVAALERDWRAALGRAARAGTPAEKIVAIDESYRARRRAIRDDAEARTARAWLGPTGPLGIRVDLRPNGLGVQALWLMATDADLYRLLQPGREVARFAASLPRRPELLVQATLEPDRARGLIEWLVRQTTRDDSLLAEAATVGKLVRAWDGSLGLAMIAGEPGPRPERSIGAALGVRSMAPVEAAFAEWTASEPDGPIRRGSRAGELELRLPGVKATVKLGRDRVVASTTTALLGALEGPTSSEPVWQGTGHSMLRAMATTRGAGLVAAFDLGLLAPGALPFGDAAGLDAETSDGPPPLPSGGSPTGKPAAVGDAAEAAAKLSRRLAAIEALSPQQAVRTLAAEGGLVVLRIGTSPLGWQLDLGWVTRSQSVATALELLVAEMDGSGEAESAAADALAAEVDELMAERDRLERLAIPPAVMAPSPLPAADLLDAGTTADASEP